MKVRLDTAVPSGAAARWSPRLAGVIALGLSACGPVDGINPVLSSVHDGTPSCMSAACHPSFTVAGKVFEDLEAERPLAGVEVTLLSATGEQLLAESGETGLFYTEQSLPMGTVELWVGDLHSPSHTLPNDGSCNSCHRPGSDSGTYGSLVGVDAFPPVLVSTSPQDGDVGVDIDVELWVELSEAVAPASVGQASLHLSGPEGPVPLAFEVAEGSSRILARPQQQLQASGAYTLTLERGLTDAVGNGLESSVSLQFETAGDGVPRIVGSSPSPGQAEVDPTQPIELEVAPALDPASVDSSTVALSDSCDLGGTDVALSADGLLITLTPTLPLPEGRTCRVSVDGLQSTEGLEMEGPYELGFSTWADTQPPEALAGVPSPGRTQVSPTAVIQLLWSEALDLDALDAVTLDVQADGLAVDGQLSLDDSGRVLTWEPMDPLPMEATVEVGMGALPVDLAGNVAITPAPWSFRTGSVLDDGLWENSLPRVMGTWPASGDVGFPVDGELRVVLDEDPDLRTLTSDTLSVSVEGEAVTLAIAYDGAGRAITLQPVTDLEGETEHLLVAGPGIADLCGNLMEGGVAVDFVTAGSASLDAPSFDGVTEVEGVDTDAVEVRWEPATDLVTPQDQLRYHVFLATESGGQDLDEPTVSVDGEVTTAVIEGLDAGTVHFAVVRAEDTDGNVDDNLIEASGSTLVSYAANVQPILDAYCVRCHGTGRASGDLDLSSYEAFLGSGVVVPYDSGASLLVTKGDHHGSGWYDPDEELLVSGWIDQGATNN